MGYREIEAIDWSTDAWEKNVGVGGEEVPKGVVFTPIDDERFVERLRGEKTPRFDAIVFNFGVNESKARAYAKEFLTPDVGRLLAPVNIQSDYWLKQRFEVMDARGEVLWSADEVGAWSVQFQPDVTQDTCQGIWCPQYNGFQKKRR